MIPNRIHYFDRIATDYKEVLHFQRTETRPTDKYVNSNILPFLNLSLNRKFNKSNCLYWAKFADVDKITGKRGKWSEVVTGLFKTSDPRAFYGDIPKTNYNGFKQKDTLVYFFFTANFEGLALIEFPNYYPVGKNAYKDIEYWRLEITKLLKMAGFYDLARYAHFYDSRAKETEKEQERQLKLF